MYHYTESYLLNPEHPITVGLVGVGGTGSQMLNNLGRIHVALLALGHPGLHVTAYDNDVVTEANLGRQLFTRGELDINKAVALITRVNRFYGLQWNAKPSLFDTTDIEHNIIITCVDKVLIRNQIGQIYEHETIKGRAEEKNYYWMDLGNTKDVGQVIIGTNGMIDQPKKTKDTVAFLPNITKLFENLEEHESSDDTPSCSLAEALTKQDLFVNSLLAQYGANLIWKMFRELRLEHHGVFMNLKTLTTNPIKVK